jgi:hypothetical protein
MAKERYTKKWAVAVARALEEMARYETAPGTKAILDRGARLLRSSAKRPSSMQPRQR